MPNNKTKEDLYQAVKKGLQVSASIGVASYPEDTEYPEGLVSIADKDMYKDKGGR